MTHWIDAEAPHKMIVDASKLESIRVSYKGYSGWAVVGCIGINDFRLKTLASERAAADWLLELQNRLTLAL